MGAATTVVVDAISDVRPLMPKPSALITLLILLISSAFMWLIIKGRRDKVLVFFLQTFQNDSSSKAQGVLVSAFATSIIYIMLLIRGSLFDKWPPEYVLNNVQNTLFSLFGITGLLAGAKAFADRTTQTTTELKPGPPTMVTKKETTGPAHDESHVEPNSLPA